MNTIDQQTTEKICSFMTRLLSDQNFIFNCEPAISELISKEDILPVLNCVLSQTEELDERCKMANIIHIKQIIMPLLNKISSSEEKFAFAQKFSQMIVFGAFEPKLKLILAEIYQSIIENFDFSQLHLQIKLIDAHIKNPDLNLSQKSMLITILKHVFITIFRRSKNVELDENLEIIDTFHMINQVMLYFQSNIIFTVGQRFNQLSETDQADYIKCFDLFYFQTYKQMIETISQNNKSFVCKICNPEILVKFLNWCGSIRDQNLLHFLNWVAVRLINLVFSEISEVNFRKIKIPEVCAFRNNFFTLYESQTWKIIIDYQENKELISKNHYIHFLLKNCDPICLEYLRFFSFLIKPGIAKDISFEFILRFLVSNVFPNLFADKIQLESIEDNPEEILNASEDVVENKKSGNAQCIATIIIEELCSKNRLYFDFVFHIYLLVVETLFKGKQLFEIKSALTDIFNQQRSSTINPQNVENVHLKELIENSLLIPEAVYFVGIGSDFQYIESFFLLFTSISLNIKNNPQKLHILSDFLRQSFHNIFSIPGLNGQLIVQRFYLFFMYTSNFICQDDFDFFTKIIVFGFQYLQKNKGRNVACFQILKTFSAIMNETMFLNVLQRNNNFVLETVYQIIDFKENSWVFRFLLKFNIGTTFLKENKVATIGFIVKIVEWVKMNAYYNNQSVSSSLDFLNGCVLNIHKMGLSEEDIVQLNQIFLNLFQTIYAKKFKEFVFSEELLTIVRNLVLLSPNCEAIRSIIVETLKMTEVLLFHSETTNRAVLQLFITINQSKSHFCSEIASISPLILNNYLIEAKSTNFIAYCSNSLLVDFLIIHNFIPNELLSEFLMTLFSNITKCLENVSLLYRNAVLRYKFEHQLQIFLGCLLKNQNLLSIITTENKQIYLGLILLSIKTSINSNDFSELTFSETMKTFVRLIPFFSESSELIALINLSAFCLLFNFKNFLTGYHENIEIIKFFCNKFLESSFGLQTQPVSELECELEQDQDNCSEDENEDNNEDDKKSAENDFSDNTKINRKQFLKQCFQWKKEKNVFVDEYKEFQILINQLKYVPQDSCVMVDENMEIDYKQIFKEIQTICYTEIDGKMVVRKIVKLKRK